MKALVMLGESEEIDLGMVRAPVTADAFETAGAVVQAVREQPDLRVAVLDEVAVVVDLDVSEFHASLRSVRRSSSRSAFSSTEMAVLSDACLCIPCPPSGRAEHVAKRFWAKCRHPR